MQREVLNRCLEQKIRLNPDHPLDMQVIKDLSVPESQQTQAICERTVAALARGELSLQDMEQVNKGMFTPAMLRALRTPAKVPVTPRRT